MENVLSYFTAHPVHVLIAGVIVLVLIFAAVKKVIQLIIFAAIILAIHLAYVTHVSAETRASIRGSIESGPGKLIKAGEKSKESLAK